MTLCRVVMFCQVTVVPDATVRDVGEKVVDSKQNVVAGQFGDVVPPPQETKAIARARAPNKPEIVRILPP